MTIITRKFIEKYYIKDGKFNYEKFIKDYRVPVNSTKKYDDFKCEYEKEMSKNKNVEAN